MESSDFVARSSFGATDGDGCSSGDVGEFNELLLEFGGFGINKDDDVDEEEEGEERL